MSQKLDDNLSDSSSPKGEATQVGANFDFAALVGKATGQDQKAIDFSDSGSKFVDGAPKSYLETFVDKGLSFAIDDKATRNTADHYACEFLTTAALFAGGKAGLAGTLVLYGLNSASPDTSTAQAAEDFALGAARGVGTRAIFSLVGNLPTAPLKGLVSGVASRVLDDVVSRDTFTDPAKTMEHLKNDTFNGRSMLADAATWTIGEGLFHGANRLSGGKLAADAAVQGMTMGATFGAVNGVNAEISREKAAHESVDITRIIQHGLIEATIGGAAAGAGMHLGGGSVHISEGRNVDRTAKAVETKPPQISQPGVSISLGELKNLNPARIITGDQKSLSADIPSDIYGATPMPEAQARPRGPARTEPVAGGDQNKQPNTREFVIDSGGKGLKNFKSKSSDGEFVNVREKLLGGDGKATLGPKKLLFVQKLGAGDNSLKAGAEKADFIVSSHPEVLSDAARAKHIFPEGEGKVWLALGGKGGKGDTLRLATGDVQLNQWRKEGFVDPVRLDNGNVTLSVMAPLLVGDPKNMDSPASKAAWTELDRQLAVAKQLGIDAVSTDVWWGLVEPEKGKFDWSYYEKISQHIADAGLKWVPILSFHQCGGNVGDDAYVPLPSWVWSDVAGRASGGDVEAVKYKSEQGHTSPEYVSLFADHAVMDNYANVMKNFQDHFAARAKDIGEINVSLGPAGEMRYPSYNGHDNNTGYPTRGALQAYSPLAIQSFRQYVKTKYGDHAGAGKAWGIENLDDSHILPPDDASAFFGRGDHFNTQYGRDFIDWYSQSLIDHGQAMLSTAVKIFGQKDSAYYGIDIGAKFPGVHWRIGERQGDNVILGDRLAEVTAGLIRTSRGDWDRDSDGRGYRPIFSMIKGLQPLNPGLGSRIVPGFTCLEMPDGDGGPSVKALPHSLATWAGQEAERQGLWLKGENALNGNLYNNNSWDLMRDFLTLPNQHGLYHGLTFLRLQDIVNSDVARARVAQINNARTPMELVAQSLRRMFGRAA